MPPVHPPSVDDYVDRLIEQAPPLTDEQVDRLSVLLRPPRRVAA